MYICLLLKVELFDEDSLIHHNSLSLSWASAMIQSALAQEESLHKIELPVLLYHGSEDSVVPLKSSRHIHTTISSSDKELKVRNTHIDSFLLRSICVYHNGRIIYFNFMEL